ncbi:MAG: transporter substrate-binding domain-containing protein, partial [Lachnospiraceae bacterium]|nr:transporter substrate-binding domain-containing protein [Lachnospiraceae bacterium]
ESVKEEVAVENATKKLVMATNAEFPPYEYKDGNEYKGIDIDCAKLIASKLGMELEIMDIAFDSIIPTVMSGKADFAMAGMTVTEDRKENVDFTDTYQKAVQSVVVTENSDINTVDDLTDKKIGVQTGTTGDIYCTDDFGDANVERYSKHVDAIAALKSGKIDAVVVDDQVAIALAGSTDGLKILDTSYAEEEYAIGVKKGNAEMLSAINAVIKEIKGNGELAKIVAEYIK